MKKTEATFRTEPLRDVVHAACTTYQQWSIVDPAFGRELVIEPDSPATGFVTLTIWEPDDD
jgi:hypothetical protein